MRETRKKWLCLALASILLLTLSLPPAKATETLVAEDANAYTPVEAQNLLTAKDTGHAYSPFPEEEAECGKPTPEYVPGEAIYARTGGASLFGADDSALAALGVSESEAIDATGTESARLMGASEEIIYYIVEGTAWKKEKKE